MPLCVFYVIKNELSQLYQLIDKDSARQPVSNRSKFKGVKVTSFQKVSLFFHTSGILTMDFQGVERSLFITFGGKPANHNEMH